MRIGHGYDVHKIATGRKLYLGGVEIPCEFGLDGHSDADVLLHAIMDALLGAAGQPDIGVFFPPNDDKYLGIRSTILAKEVLNVINKKWTIVNIDSTLIAQKPKLMPYIKNMRVKLAEIFEIDVDQVNVKATTEEHLGFTGRGEGISAHAVCLIVEKKEEA